MNLTIRDPRYLFTLFLIIYLPLTSTAQSTPERSQSSAETLVKRMALDHQLSEAPEEIRAQFEQNPFQITAIKNEQMLQKFDEAYASDLMLTDFKAALQKELTDSYQSEITGWLNTEDTELITDARQFYYTLQGKRQRVINRYEMDQAPPSEQRIGLISTLTDTTSVAESSVESSVIILRSIIEAINQISAQHDFSDTQIGTIANNFRAQMQAQAGEQLNRQQIVMYYNVPDEALSDYISFWGTETGQWLDKAINQSMEATYKQAGDRFLESINAGS